MSQKKQLSILEFSRLSGIKRDNLRFYDRIGLLSPETRGENGYRYYGRRQLNSAYLIGSLRQLGVGLEDIRQYSANRTPDKLLAFLARQEEFIQEEISKLHETSSIIDQYADMAREALQYNEDTFLLKDQKQERIFLCPPVPDGMSEDDGSIFAYEYANARGVNLGCPLGAMVLQKNSIPQGATPVYQYYFKTGKKGNAWKPQGLYALAYGEGDPYHSEGIYWRLMDFIREQRLEIVGNAYEECLMDELAVHDTEQFRYRIEVPVKRSI